MNPAPDDVEAAGPRDDSRLVIVSNRLPVRRVRDRGTTAWRPSPGGLVSALTPVLRQRGGHWIGWAGQHNASAPAKHGGIALTSVPLSRQDVRDYYAGFSNASLWPLYHGAIRPAEFDHDWWETYEDVNARFARTVAAQAPRGARVWVQDYHLHRVPALLRQLRPDVRIGFFLHIPFPPPELFQQLPWRELLLEGLLGADVVGFQTARDAENFRRSVLELEGVSEHSDGLSLTADPGRRIVTGAFPISIDTAAFEELARQPRTHRAAARLRGRLGGIRRIVIGVDRLDYTKGIEQRLLAYRKLLEDGRIRADECVLVQIAVPSREQIRDYADQRAAVERLVGEINGRYGEPGLGAVHYTYRSLPIDRLVAHYVAADLMVVTPFRDGMNLVAKEYVASRVEDDGVLLLSEFAGAARELGDAVMVNPYDVPAMADAIVDGLSMDADEARTRMRRLRQTVRRKNVHQWAADFLRYLDADQTTPQRKRREAASRRSFAAQPAS